MQGGNDITVCVLMIYFLAFVDCIMDALNAGYGIDSADNNYRNF